MNVDAALLDRRWRDFRWLVERTAAEAHDGRFERAAVLAEFAAHHATWQHHGAFASPDLERVIGDIAHRGLGAAPAGRERRSGVLHVTSMVSGLAGLQHMIVRWISADRDQEHSVALTRPSSGSIPPRLAEAIRSSGGAFHPIGDLTPETLERARLLRELVTGFRSIVLHLETEDVVPLLALAGPPRGSSMLVNHADHSFWIGATTVDLVVNLRDAGDRLCKTRRGLGSDRSVILPTPVDVPESSAPRAETRRALSVPDDAVMLLSVARAPKYDSRGGPHFAELLVPVLQRCPNTHLVVAGPYEDDRWRSASRVVGGRIGAVGLRSDAADLMAAADIYVDSFPMTSITSLLEAGSHGLPLVGLDASDDPTGIWTAGAPGLDPVMRRCRHADELTDALAHLIDDPSDRLARGHETRNAVCGRHTGTGWSGQLADIYRTADRTAEGRGDRKPPSSVPRLAGEFDLLVAALMTAVDGVSALHHFRHRLPGRVLVPTLWRVWPGERRALAHEVARLSIGRVLDAVGLRLRAASALDRWRKRSG